MILRNFKHLYIVALISGSPQPIHLRPFSHLSRQFRHRISITNFIGESVPKRAPKFLLPTGSFDDPTDAFVDTIAVEIRKVVLSMFLENYAPVNILTRKSTHKDLTDADPELISGTYYHYLLGAMYMESGVMGLFLRTGYQKQNIEEPPFDTCAEFVTYMRQYFLDKYQYSLDHVTPGIIRDWFLSFAELGSFRVTIDSNYSKKTADEIPAREVVNMEPQPWKKVLEARFNRLLLTGYENIDL